jgi:hypothetical protein
MSNDENVEWYHWTNAVHASEEDRNRYIREIVANLRSANSDYTGRACEYIACGNVVVLGFREKTGIHIKVMQPVRTANFSLEPTDDREPHPVTDVYDSQSADHR